MRYLRLPIVLLALAFAAAPRADAQCPLNPTDPSVTICQPADGATVTSPARLVAGTTSSSPVTAIKVYVDYIGVVTVNTPTIDTQLTLAPGKHRINVQAWNQTGAVFKQVIFVTVSSAAVSVPPCVLSTALPSVTLCTPQDGITLSSPVRVIAAAQSSRRITAMKVYVDYAGIYQTSTAQLDTRLNLAPGRHYLNVQAWDASGAVFKKTANITVASAPGSLTKLNHIIWMMQENRSFDHYFSQMNAYRAMFGLSQDVQTAPPSNRNYSTDGATWFSPFALTTTCIDEISPGWNESHRAYNLGSPASDVAAMDGFVWNAAHYAQLNSLHDAVGQRAMGYYDWNMLPWYYSVAKDFAISDRWFSPAPTNSPTNRFYSLAGTSQGYVHAPKNTLTAKTIFQALEEHGISWKVYYTDKDANGVPASYMNNFWGFTSQHQDKFVPVSQFAADAQSGTLPAVALIETGYLSGRDEHPGGTTTSDPSAGNSVQRGAAFVAGIADSLMNSPSWQDSAFIWSFDEFGGLYDHVPAQTGVPNPDGIQPLDLQSADVVSDFTRTGFRVPFILISPYARKNYVSHDPADHTAILRLIEARFGLSSLTQRDAAQIDMMEFFDFNNPPWLIPPSRPVQPTTGTCHSDYLP